MNRDLLEALGALAADVYLDAMKRHPGLFPFTDVRATDEDRRLLPILWQLDQLLVELERVLRPAPAVKPPPDDDIPF